MRCGARKEKVETECFVEHGALILSLIHIFVTAVELLSGIPSVVFGLLGMQVLVPAEIGRAHV